MFYAVATMDTELYNAQQLWILRTEFTGVCRYDPKNKKRLLTETELKTYL